MAQTKKKRRRKHSGTQAGTVARRPAPQQGRPATKEQRRDAREQARQRRLERPPTLKAAAFRAAIASMIFMVVVILLFGQPLASGLGLGAVTFLLYIPIGYYIDLAAYRRHQRKHGKAAS